MGYFAGTVYSQRHVFVWVIGNVVGNRYFFSNSNYPSLANRGRGWHAHEALNRERLELVDLLLRFDADKYLVAKLSTASVAKLSKKSQKMLRKWYEAPRTAHRHRQPEKVTSCGSRSVEVNLGHGIDANVITFGLIKWLHRFCFVLGLILILFWEIIVF